jgi:hypothetical protein
LKGFMALIKTDLIAFWVGGARSFAWHSNGRLQILLTLALFVCRGFLCVCLTCEHVVWDVFLSHLPFSHLMYLMPAAFFFQAVNVVWWWGTSPIPPSSPIVVYLWRCGILSTLLKQGNNNNYKYNVFCTSFEWVEIRRLPSHHGPPSHFTI